MKKKLIPYWFLALELALILILAGIGIGATARRAASKPAACSSYTWTVHDVIEAGAMPGYGRIVWAQGGQTYQHDFPTNKHVGDEVLLVLTFDCTGKRISTVDRMEVTP